MQMIEGELKRRIRIRVYECLDDGGLTLEEMEKRDRAGESDLHGDPVVNYTDLEAIIDEAAKDFPLLTGWDKITDSTGMQHIRTDYHYDDNAVHAWFKHWFGGQK